MVEELIRNVMSPNIHLIWEGKSLPELDLLWLCRSIRMELLDMMLLLSMDEHTVRRSSLVSKVSYCEPVIRIKLMIDLVPLANRADMSKKDLEMERPDEEAVMSTAERTRLALEKITHGKIKAAQPKHVPKGNNDASYIRYTPANNGGDEGKQRIIKMTEVQEDPLEPPKFKHKKIPRAPDEPPPPVLQSPPRAVTAQDQKDWMIPPCISNWKNNKGYTVPLDKRLAADGRGLQDVSSCDVRYVHIANRIGPHQ